MGNNIRELLDQEGTAAESAELMSDPAAPLPNYVKVTRGHNRSSVLQIRLSDDEMETLAAVAKSNGLPVSTVARSILIGALVPNDDAGATLSRIETEIAQLRRVIAKF